MYASLIIILTILMSTGCVHKVSRKGVLSEELPITVSDIGEIRQGEQNHENVLKQYALYKNPRLEAYLNEIASDLAEVSIRPTLPYRVFILDIDEVNVFGGPGGYIYITRGLLNFVLSEGEIAGVIAHEIAHISVRDYTDYEHYRKIKMAYMGLLKGTEIAKSAIGTYGTAANFGVKAMGRAAPYVARQFDKDAEIIADEKAVEYLLTARYDPRAFQQFVERLARVEIEDVSRFVNLMNAHPPFRERREILQEIIQEINFEDGKIEFRKNAYAEASQQEPVQQTDSILFEPELGIRRIDPMEMSQLNREKEQKLMPIRKRMEFF
ncbi:MAG TPA: M48 family metalloprotease [bacterium]|nr:M48 family metalloprotease [bacterium]